MMKRILLFVGMIMALGSISSQTKAQHSGYYRTPIGNTEYHHFTRSSIGAAVYINQISTGPILRLSSGIHDANKNVLFTVENDGKVGIGTTTPTEKFEVFGSTTSPGVLSLKSNRQDATHVNVGRISAKQNTTEVARIGMPRAGGSNTGYLTFWTKASNSSNLTEKFRIDENGKVGIGTTTPTENLEVYGSLTTPGVLSLKSNRNDATHVNVGRISAKQNTTEIARIGMPRAGGSNTGYLTFWTKESNSVSLSEKLRISASGNVGIGTTTPDYKLDVVGNIRAHEIKVTTEKTADFVFHPSYDLPSLEEVDAFVKENHHLPEIASAKEMEENGLNMAEFQIQLLQKVEELTLYMIDMQKQMQAKDVAIEALQSEIEELKR